ncbi:MAG: hemolysin family protein [Pseudomonadota bacterium]|nr:hemolysin family protein [Pseudomonadota bacterium]
MNVWIELAIIVGLILVNGFFAMAEMAVVSSRRLRLQAMAEEGSRGANRALTLLENPNRFLSGVQVGITGISVLSGALGGATLGARLGDVLETFPLFAGRGHEIAVALVVVAITMLSLIVGELLPKRIALSNPERIAAKVARPLQIVVAGARPLVWLLEKTTEATLALLKIPQEREDRVTEEEVKLAIAEGTDAGVIHEVEQEMMHGVLGLADNTVTSVMTPRPDVFWIDLEDDPKDMAREIADCPYSRLVVARGGDLGRPLGVVQKKDLVADLIAERGIDVQRHLLEPIYLPENISVLRVLEMFRAVTLHIAFVVDEYGDFLGLVTLADVLGAIAGDMPQEHEPQSETIKRRADGTWLVDGRTPIEELITRLDLNIDGGDYHTAAGLALDRLARIPEEGDRFVLGDWRVEIIDMDGKRIDKLLFTPPPPAATTQ